jgi:spore maturation protein CgeB
VLCVFGKHQYGDKGRGLSTEYFSFIPAFEELGYDVSHFDSWDSSLYSDYADLNAKFLFAVDEVRPDVIFAVTLGYEIWMEVWDIVRQKSDAVLIHWSTDDSWKFREHSIFIANCFDLNVTTYAEFIPKYKEIGASAFLSGWGCPVQWLSEPKKSTDCRYGVTFVGSAHGNRKELVAKLGELGINVECFGYGWENGAVNAEEIPVIFRDSVVSLNFANSKGENQIKARTFEVPGSGGFLITDNAKNLSSVFCNNKEIIIVDSLEEMANATKQFIESREDRDHIAKQGFLRVKNQYSYAKRVSDILDFAVKIERKQHLVPAPNFDVLLKRHRLGIGLKLLKLLLVFMGQIVFGKKKGYRFARRASFELEWRIRREKTYGHSGWTGRMFYGY